MDAQLRATAETRLTEAAAAAGLADPRRAFRERLKSLRESEAAAFETAVAHYEQVVLPRLADSDPLPVWADYGAFLGALTSEGSLTSIDSTGRAVPWRAPYEAGTLVIFLPGDTREEVLTLLQPLVPSDAQRATLDLLVYRKLALG